MLHLFPVKLDLTLPANEDPFLDDSCTESEHVYSFLVDATRLLRLRTCVSGLS